MRRGRQLRLAAALLAATFATFAAGASRAPAVEVRPLDGARPDLGLDWSAVRARTERFDRARETARALSAPALFEARVSETVAVARTAVGPPPGFLSRLVFPFELPADRRAALEAAAVSLEALGPRLDADLAAARTWVEEAGRDAPAPVRDGLQARLRELEMRTREAAVRADRAAGAVRMRAGGFFSRSWLLCRGLVGRDGPTLLAGLQATLDRWGVRGPAQLIGADLTYVEGALRPGPLPLTRITPAYQAGDAPAGGLEDTTHGREIDLSPPIAAKASELGTARRAFAFVRNEVQLEWYFGSLKGARETLREGRGNDADLAALLIALLRAQGTPARYVRGTVELPVGRVASLMGLLDAAAIGGADAEPDVDEPTRQRVLAALAAAGIPYQPVTQAGRVTALRFLHVWVEAWLPYADYRGTAASPEGRQWVPLDPAFPGVPRYGATPPALDALQAMGTDAAALVQSWLAEGAGKSPLAFTRERAAAWLAANRPDLGWAQLLRTVAQQPEALGILPPTLPYAVPAVHEELAFLPDDAKHRVRITVGDAAGVVLDATLPMHDVVGQRTLLAFEPATDADALAVTLAGGLYRVPAASVSVAPVLRVAGEARARGARGFGLGAEASWTIELLLPDGSSRRITNRVVAGNLVAIGLGGPRNGYDPADATQGDGAAAAVLYRAAADYANAWTEGEEELARLLQVVPIRPTANLVLVENQLHVDEVLGVRRRVVWKGLEVDADHRSMTPIELVPGRGRALLRLSGFEGSFQEARVLETATGEQAISAVRVVQEAFRTGVPVLTLTPAGAASQLPGLATSPEVLREVQSQLARGREVVIPAADLTVRDWTGTGLVARDPATDEGGYFLSGLISGGQTVVSPAFWQDKDLLARLEDPTAPEPTDDVTRVARIIKIPSSDLQRTVVGKRIANPLAVRVTTAEGVPVKGARVRFRVLGDSQAKLEPASSLGRPGGIIDVETDRTGVARAWFDPDTRIAASAILEPANPYRRLVGFGEVMAETFAGDTTIAVPSPFTVLADPDVPARLELPCSLASADNFCGREYELGIQLGQALWVRAVDRFGNAIANAPVAWTSSPISGTFIDLATVDGRAARILDPNDSAQFTSLHLVTDTTGTGTTDFIPALEGRLDLYATLGALQAIYGIHVSAPAPENPFIFRLKANLSTTFDGVYRSAFQEPMGGQVFRWRGDPDRPWELLTGRPDGNVTAVRVRMEVSDHSGPSPLVLRTETVEPWMRLNLQMYPSFDDETTATFWPEYEVDGDQRHTFIAEVTRDDGKTVECSDRWFIPSRSRRPTIETHAITPGFNERPLEDGAAVAPGDLAVGVRILNPASYPIYARIVETPTLSGERLVELPPPDQLVRHPEDPGLLRLIPGAVTTLRLGLVPGAHGGRLRVELSAPEPRVGSLAVAPISYVDRSVIIPAPGAALVAAAEKTRPQLVIPIRNPESTATPAAGKSSPETATEEPFAVRAALDFRVRGEGLAEVFVNGSILAAAAVVADDTGTLLIPPVPVPDRVALKSAEDGAIRAWVPPQDPTITTGTIRFTSILGAVEERTFDIETVVRDVGALPIGHTFVKDVSVVDGHLVKQATDIGVTGRGPALAFQRTYTSRGNGPDGASPLGEGWTHGFRSWVVKELRDDGHVRYLLVGGEGTGQIFDCTDPTTGCRSQRGFHGKLTPGEDAIVYVAPTGVEYRYAQLSAAATKPRWWLSSVTDPRGNTLTLEYGPPSVNNEVVRVFEAGNHRALQLSYRWPAGATRLQLATVELMANDTGEAGAGAALRPIDQRGACVAYGYDANGNVASAARFDGRCGPIDSAARVESYTYEQSTLEEIRGNLRTVTDPNGRTTEYVYVAADAKIAGEGQFLLMADKQERVHEVREPAPGGVTTFDYVMTPAPAAVLGTVRPLFATVVRGPRFDVGATTYRFDPYGTTNVVERPYGTGQTVVTSSEWDRVHIRPVATVDARGRKTTLRYDDAGNVVERRTLTGALPAMGAAPVVEAVVDGDGAAVAEVVEKFAYDPGTGGETCHVDAEGRVTVTSYALGLPVTRRAHAEPLPAARVVSDAPCEQLAAEAIASERDRLTTYAYCDVNGPCPTGGRKGDLVATQEGARRIDVLGYDVYGASTGARRSGSDQAAVVTSLVHDPRGRLQSETDSLGHLATRTWDGLDRPLTQHRENRKGGSPGEYRTWAYWPAGQVHEERLGTPQDPDAYLSRTIELDGLNLPWTITERGQELEPQVTVRTHDAAGNEVAVLDPRGVLTETTFDQADRPILVSVSVADAAAFAAQGGDAGGWTGRTIVSRATFDAAGNKLSETDVHGHVTRFGLDALYRAVAITSPPVLGMELGSAGTVEYTTRRRFDRSGNRVAETDGNGATTRWRFDFANREVETVDPAGRFQRRVYDVQGDLFQEVAGVRDDAGIETVHLTRAHSYDGVGRPLSTTEQFADGAGTRTQETTVAYDDANHRVWTRDGRGFVVQRSLDDLDRVFEEVVDAPSGLLARRPDVDTGDPLALTTRYQYDLGGKRTVTVDPEGRTTEERWDALGRVVRRTLPMAAEERFRVDAAGRVIWRRDVRGIESWTTYDPIGRPRVESVAESVGGGGARLALLTRVYQDAGSDVQVQEVDALIRTTVRHLDGLEREWKVDPPDRRATETRYDARHPRRYRDRNGYVTEVDVDPVGRPVAIRDLDRAGSQVYLRTASYDDAARAERRVDRRGIPLSITRDGLGRVASVARGDVIVQTESREYDAANHVVRAVDPNGHATEWVHDGAGRRIRETRAAGLPEAATTAFRHDRAGNLVERKGPRATGAAYDERVAFDDLNHPVRVEDALGHVTTRVHDAAGNVLCERRPRGGDPLGLDGAKGKDVGALTAAACGSEDVTRFAYDELGKLVSVEDAAGLTTYVHDAARQLVAKQDGNGNVTTYAYDAIGRRTDEWQHLDAHARLRSRGEVPEGAGEGPPDVAGGTGALHWSVRYDDDADRVVQTDPRSMVTVARFDLRGRVVDESFTAAANPNVAQLEGVRYAWDGNDNPELITAVKAVPGGTTIDEVTDPTYDRLDRLEGELREGKLVKHAYDAKGNRTGVTDPDGVATTYAFDGLDRLIETRIPQGTATHGYWPDGLPRATVLPNGIAEGRCYDAAGRLTAIVRARGAIGEDCTTASPVVARVDYAYDANGNRSRQTERGMDPATQRLGDPEETGYAYDAVDRLVGVLYPGGAASLYGLDAAGNRVREVELASAGAGDVLPAAWSTLDPAKVVRDVTATFNRADWVTKLEDARDHGRDVAFGWDLAGNLVSKEKQGLSRRLQWDGRNGLVRVADNGADVGVYDYDGAGLRTRRKTATEDVAYVLDGQFVLQELDASQPGRPAYRRYHYANEPLAVVDAAGARFVGSDALGSPTELLSGSGAVVDRRQYDAWGRYRNGTAPAGGAPKLGYTGHQFDPETGLVYARARYYDPDLGRFISRDAYEGELEDAPSLHRYAYANGNPLLFVDPDGNAAYEAAEEWEKRQREVAWTGEEGVEGAKRDSARFANWAAAKLGDNWFSNSVGGLGVAAVQSVIELTGTLGAAVGDPTMLIRAPMRIGVGAAQGVEDIGQGKILEGSLKIVADTAGAVETAVGGYAMVRSALPARVGTAHEPSLAARRQVARETVVEEVRAARATEQTARVAVREGLSESLESSSRLLEKHSADLGTLMAREQARTPALAARLADRAANEPGFTVAMDRAAGAVANSTPIPANASPRPVLVDSNAVAQLTKEPTLGGRVGAGDSAAVSYVTGPELRNAVTKGSLRGVPRALEGMPVLRQRPSIDAIVSFRGRLTRARGRFGDGVIGAQSVHLGIPLVTNDAELAATVRGAGGVVR